MDTSLPKSESSTATIDREMRNIYISTSCIKEKGAKIMKRMVLLGYDPEPVVDGLRHDI